MRLLSLSVTLIISGLLLSTAKSKSSSQPETFTVVVELVDAESGDALPGVLQVVRKDGTFIDLSELLSRGQGVRGFPEIHKWYVLPRATELTLPNESLVLRGFHGLETEYGEVELAVNSDVPGNIQIPLLQIGKETTQAWQNANTHVHLQRINRAESDRYLIDVASADGLDLVFISYLERAEADRHYVTNRYSPDELRQLSTKHVHFGHGEEHRHNFGAGGEGYGHVMLLDIPELIYPVSIGPGISKTGTDGIPLRRGIEKAHEVGGAVIWCHNAWGLEDIPSWLEGSLHANNIFDGGTQGSFEDSFYRYLDLGILVPFSTGTDWFIYDFSRVYVPAKTRLSATQWLDQLKLGKSFITNGPLLEFEVDGVGPGNTLGVTAGTTLTISASAHGRSDFGSLELVQNGRVIERTSSERWEGHYRSKISYELTVAEPCWLALRTPPPPENEVEGAIKHLKNDYGREIFSHTSALFVDVDDQRVFRQESALALRREILRSLDVLKQNGLFADDSERTSIVGLYQHALEELDRRMNAVRQ